MKKRSRFKKNILALHKIVGITTGLVVFIVSITGCCWVFKDEIESLYSDYKKVTPQEVAFLAPTKAKELAKQVFPNKHVHGTLYQKADDALEVVFYQSEPEFYQSVFLNPYSGEVLHVQDHLSGFFAFVLKGHTRLWLPKQIGEQIVGVSVLLFLFMIISGIIIWWPKKRKHLKKRISFKWKSTTRWKRKNFDLHSIIGFYACSLALAIAFTGAVMAYDLFYYITYKSFGGNNAPQFIIPNNSNPPTKLENNIYPMDRLIAKLQKENPEAESFELHYPATDSTSIYIEISHSKGLHYDADFRFFDQYTLAEIPTPSIYGTYKDASFADKVIRMNYDIHIGSIGGLTGKIIAFFISLAAASLPITGILLWFGRKYKKRNKD